MIKKSYNRMSSTEKGVGKGMGEGVAEKELKTTITTNNQLNVRRILTRPWPIKTQANEPTITYPVSKISNQLLFLFQKPSCLRVSLSSFI